MQRSNSSPGWTRSGGSGSRARASSPPPAMSCPAARLPIEFAGAGHAFQFVFGDAMLADTFHEWAPREGLLLSPGDNQLPSLAFAGNVVDECVVLRRLTARLADHFPIARRAAERRGEVACRVVADGRIPG